MPVLAGQVLPTRYRGDGGLALGGEGVTDTPMLTDRRFPTRDTAIPTTVEVIQLTVTHTSIHKLESIRKKLEELKKQEVKNA